ncbi:MAG: calcium-binding protein [Rhodobacteraceae bacterium]|jgi:Ca2+-binding RTX toxin-like protein|nr:calcium-binding protein [Paracoccaceae bacterium]
MLMAVMGLAGVLAVGLLADGFFRSGEDQEGGGGEEAPEEPAAPDGSGEADDLVARMPALPGSAGDAARDDAGGGGGGDGDGDGDGPPVAGGDGLMVGGDGNDLLAGGRLKDQLYGRGGHDLIGGGDGNDTLDGGDGSDTLHGGAGDDLCIGGAGNDSIDGDIGDDTLLGGDGDDRLNGQDGDDWLDGGAGNDALIGGPGADTLTGGEGDDTLAGGQDGDTLSGGLGQDLLFGDDGDDVISGVVLGPGGDGPPVDLDGQDFLNGGNGNDTLVGGADDVLNGGAGADLFAVGDWIDGGKVATITDYDPAEDRIGVVFDPAATPDPVVTVETEGDTAYVLLNGVRVAAVPGGAGLTAADIELIANTPDSPVGGALAA